MPTSPSENQPEFNRELEVESILACARQRRDSGAITYGENSFLGRSALTDAEEELLDLVNYAIFGIIKIRLLKESHPTL